MMLNEDRLRELYAAGEIDLAEFERGLDIVLGRNRPRPAASRAPEPLTPAEREHQADRIATAPEPERPSAEKCPVCRSELRPVTENGIRTAWCAGCNTYRGPDPRAAERGESREAGSVWVAGGIFPLGPHGIDLG
jgi:hypothetical protein